jgi:plastocyanin
MKVRILGLASVAALAIVVAGCAKKAEQPAAEKTAAPAATVNPATAGTITGTVKLDGTAPKMPIIKMGADPACLKNNKGPVHSEQVVVGKDNALQNVVVYIKSGLGNYSYPTPTAPAKLDQDGCMYTPHILTLMTGQKFEVINSDPLTHNIHVMPQDNRQWNESQPQNAAPIVKEFARAEMGIPVKCNIHPWMKAYICVFDNPYYAVTGDDGTFTLKNVPPGTYTIDAWQEKYGHVEQQVTVGASETKTVNFSFKAQ